MEPLITSFSQPQRSVHRPTSWGFPYCQKVVLYKQIFDGLQFCPDPVACMARASKGGFAYISWKVTYMELFDKDSAVKSKNRWVSVTPTKSVFKLVVADTHLDLTVLSVLNKCPWVHNLFPDLPARYNCQKLHWQLWEEADLSGKLWWRYQINCALQARGFFNTPSYVAWAFQSGSPLKPDFDRVILKLSEVTVPIL